MDRWADAVVEALYVAGAGEPDLSGSLTGGRFRITLTVDATGAAEAEAVATELLVTALDSAAMPGLTVRTLSVSATAAGTAGRPDPS
jgi:hypothetical protein